MSSRPCWLLYGNVYQTKKNKYVSHILHTICRLGVQVYVEETFARFIEDKLGISTSHCPTFNSNDTLPQADAAISVGGDGTFLTTAARVGQRGIPILGINTGHLGFLADVSPQHIESSLTMLLEGEYVIEERSALQVMVDQCSFEIRPYGLNEVAVLKHDNSSLIEVETYINHKLLTTYSADGLIVCTPTGSTGYSLSVGGPILMPTTSTFCLSPVAPHSLSVRPVVVGDDVIIDLNIHTRSHRFLLSVDGVSQSLPETSTITVKRAERPIKAIKIQHTDFWATLREKMMWGADIRNL